MTTSTSVVRDRWEGVARRGVVTMALMLGARPPDCLRRSWDFPQNPVHRRCTPSRCAHHGPMADASRPKPHVLVVDDEEHITELVAMGLGYNGFDVERVS